MALLLLSLREVNLQEAPGWSQLLYLQVNAKVLNSWWKFNLCFRSSRFTLRSHQSSGQSWKNRSLEIFFSLNWVCWVFLFHNFHFCISIACLALSPAVLVGTTQEQTWERVRFSSVQGCFVYLWDTETGGGFEKKGREEWYQSHLHPYSCCMFLPHWFSAQWNSDLWNSSAKPQDKLSGN